MWSFLVEEYMDRVIIILNDELGYEQYAVVDADRHEYWHDSFFTMDCAERFASDCGLLIVDRWDRRSSNE